MQLPARIGKYEVVQYLGGGMSAVFRARDTHLGRTVALKILTEAGLADEAARARLLQEARLVGGLAHENIISFYDYGEEGGRPYLVMEFLEGESLRAAMRSGRTGDLRNKLLIARQIAGALAYTHSRKIIHRDVKPDNIRIDAAGRIKLMDFGVAKSEELSLTGAGFTLGTPYYMAPEQIRGERPAPAVDVYAFGVVLFELVTGTRPFEGQTVDDIFDRILHHPLDGGPLERAGVPQGVRRLIEECTAKEPERRPQDFAVLVRAIDGILDEAPIPWWRKKSVVLVAVACAAILLLGIILVARAAR